MPWASRSIRSTDGWPLISPARHRSWNRSDRFGFNQALLPGTSAKESTAAEPQSSHGLMLMGAGLDHEVKISPLHAAVMMAAIANGGRMMAPGLTDKITDSKGADKEAHTLPGRFADWFHRKQPHP